MSGMIRFTVERPSGEGGVWDADGDWIKDYPDAYALRNENASFRLRVAELESYAKKYCAPHSEEYARRLEDENERLEAQVAAQGRVVEAARLLQEQHEIIRQRCECELCVALSALPLASEAKPCGGIKNGLRCGPCVAAGKPCAPPPESPKPGVTGADVVEIYRRFAPARGEPCDGTNCRKSCCRGTPPPEAVKPCCSCKEAKRGLPSGATICTCICHRHGYR